MRQALCPAFWFWSLSASEQAILAFEDQFGRSVSESDTPKTSMAPIRHLKSGTSLGAAIPGRPIYLLDHHYKTNLQKMLSKNNDFRMYSGSDSGDPTAVPATSRPLAVQRVKAAQ